MIVKSELQKLGLQYKSVELGEIHLIETANTEQLASLKASLGKSGLELMDDKRSILIEKIKTVIVEMIHYTEELPKVNFSVFISKKLNYEYKYLSNLFTEVQGTTIEQYIILHKIERVKELLTYDDMSLTEIAEIMQYSSVAALANQFKKVTGLTSQHFKKMQVTRRQTLEDL
jgi:AraC-like DNA-binding protein